jgi:fructoselysine 6-kinase
MPLVAIGDNVVDRYVDLGLEFPGGNCLNVAVHAARSGTRTAYVGVVGDDEPGRLTRAALQAEGVDESRLHVRSGPTARADVRHVAGDRVFGDNDKGVSLFDPTPADLDFVARFDLAHSSYCSGLEAVLPSVAARVPLSFDFDDRTGDYAEGLLPEVWVATFSAADLSRRQTEDLLRWAASRGPAWVFATRGAQGAMAFDGSEVYSAAPEPVDAVDSLGAGDAFIGRALHGLLAGESPRVVLAAAVAAGGAACGSLGGFGHGRPLTVSPPAAAR